VGRFWVEALRSDQAIHFLGMRLNDWVSIIVFLGALAYFVMVKGPQLRIVTGEDGQLRTVPVDAPDGGSAEESAARDADAQSVDAEASGEDADGDSGGTDPPDDPAVDATGPGSAGSKSDAGEHEDETAHSTAEK
jgi:hypothetical protein